MTYLDDHAFQATVNSRIQDRSRRGLPTDYRAVFGDLLDIGLVPKRQTMWDWARRVCAGEAAA
jgi:hypothetical protein